MAAIGIAAAVAVSVFAHISSPMADVDPDDRIRERAQQAGPVEVLPPGAP